ncbi:MAG: hypothetical protein ACKODB_12165 [Betaproteobacteria bacterium]
MPLTLLCQNTLSPPATRKAAAPSPSRPADSAWLQLARQSKSLSRLLAQAGPPVPLWSLPDPGRTLARDSGVEAWLRSSFGLPDEVGIGACAALALHPSATSLILRLVHFHAAMDHIVLSPTNRVAVAEAESLALFDSACDWLREEPVRLRRLSADLWELVEIAPSETGFAALRSASSTRAAGRNIDLWLPYGTGARRWRRLMNELQMLWHSHPVNEQRIDRGDLPLNGLWLEGVTPGHASPVFDRVATDDPVLGGLASLSGASLAGWEEGLERAIDSPATHSLIDVPCTVSQATQGDEAPARDADGAGIDWRQAQACLERIERRAGRSAIRSVILTGDFGAQSFSVNARAHWRFWRTRPDPRWLVDPAQSAANAGSE